MKYIETIREILLSPCFPTNLFLYASLRSRATMYPYSGNVDTTVGI